MALIKDGTFVDDAWVAGDEAKRRKGFVLCGGKWMLPEEADRLMRAGLMEQAKWTEEHRQRAIALVKAMSDDDPQIRAVAVSQLAELPDGALLRPLEKALFASDPKMRIVTEEIFGPVLSIIPFETDAEALAIANDTPYGLAGAVWSKDDAHAQKVARRIRAGQVDVNGGAFNMNAPFGGFKQSGHGREAGVYGLEEFLEYKSLQLKG